MRRLLKPLDNRLRHEDTHAANLAPFCLLEKLCGLGAQLHTVRQLSRRHNVTHIFEQLFSGTSNCGISFPSPVSVAFVHFQEKDL